MLHLSLIVAPNADRDLCGGYHFAGFAYCFAAGSCLPKWFIITHVWFELGTYKKVPQTLGSSVGHGRSFCKDLAQSATRIVFTRIVYISHISKHDQFSSRRGPDNLGLERA